MIQTSEILDTLRMIDREKLDVRTITMGISLFPCVSDDIGALCRRVYDRITRKAERLDKTHKYFSCPKCKARLRAPRGKGRLRITCRTCGEVFEKKT